jgi:hypothetical protein
MLTLVLFKIVGLQYRRLEAEAGTAGSGAASLILTRTRAASK